MARAPGRRPLWLTVPLYAVLLVVVVLDVRAAVFRGRVGDSLGTPVALAAGGIASGVVSLPSSRRSWWPPCWGTSVR